MNKTIKYLISLCLLLVFLFSFTSCDLSVNPIIDNGQSNLTLEASRSLNNVKYQNNNNYYSDDNYTNKLINTSFKLYNLLVDEKSENVILSPLSIYMALSLLDFIGDDIVKEEISELLELDEQEILRAGMLFSYLNREIKEEKKVRCKIQLTNSIWLDEAISQYASPDVLAQLAEELYCYAYETSFASNNSSANQDIRNFIKQQTNGLIDEDFDISADTIIALINTLYLIDYWNNKLEKNKQYFNLTKDQKVLRDFLLGEYIYGVSYEDEEFTSFYAKTSHGFKLHFIIPKGNKSIKDVMTYQNFTKALDFYSVNSKDIKNQTRCIFPSFKLEWSEHIDEAFMQQGYLSNTFNAFTTPLLENRALAVSDIIHKAVLDVNEEGIEGAAVTIIAIKATSTGPNEIIKHDFIVNKPFGLVLTTADDYVLFMGQLKNFN